MWNPDLCKHQEDIRYPKGGVAPLRHELARFEHIMNRRQEAETANRAAFAALEEMSTKGIVNAIAGWVGQVRGLMTVKRKVLQ